jgi:hypothetical protein
MHVGPVFASVPVSCVLASWPASLPASVPSVLASWPASVSVPASPPASALATELEEVLDVDVPDVDVPDVDVPDVDVPDVDVPDVDVPDVEGLELETLEINVLELLEAEVDVAPPEVVVDEPLTLEEDALDVATDDGELPQPARATGTANPARTAFRLHLCFEFITHLFFFQGPGIPPSHPRQQTRTFPVSEAGRPTLAPLTNDEQA